MTSWIIRHHRVLIAVLGTAALLGGALLIRPGLQEDYRLEAFVAAQEESYYRFRRFQEAFTSNELAIIAVQTDDALAAESLAIQRELLAAVRSLPGVERAQSLAALPPLIVNVLGDRFARHRLVVDNLISRDGRTAAVLLQMRGEDQTPAGRRETVAQLRRITEDARQQHPAARIVLAGPYVTLIDMYQYVNRDLLVFSITAALLIGLTLWVVFRRPAPMALALGVGVASTLAALGFSVVAGFATSLITQMLVILITVLAVANCVHLAVAGEESAERSPGSTPAERARRTLRQMAAPCAAVIATTAAGFASVMISTISPVRTFGLLMVVGLVFSLAAALPASVPLAKRAAPPSRGWPLASLPGMLSGMVRWTLHHRLAVILAFVGVTALLGASLGRLHFESDFVKNFRPESAVRTSYRFIEENLSPLGSMEIVIRAKDGSKIETARNVRLVRELGDAVVEKHEPIRKAMTLADLSTLMIERLPVNDVDLAARLDVLRKAIGPEFERNFVNQAGDAMRINLRAEEGVGVHRKLEIARDVEAMAAKAFGPGYEAEVTGLYPFYAGLVANLLRDQYRSFGLTVPAVFFVLLLVFRSLRAAAVAMVPNLLPIVFCLGAMGWFGVPINMTTAMTLSVTLGIAVDDTVHYVWRYRQELARCGNPAEALAATSASVGRACVFTTVVIAGGFCILMLSEFMPTAYFGGLVGFTMLGTLAADLILLPVLLNAARMHGGTPTPKCGIVGK